MYSIKTLNSISDVIYDVLKREKYAVSADAQGYDAALVRSADMHAMDMPDSLIAIARAGAGVNNIPVDKCTEEGIVVFNTPGANSNAVTELAICAMIAASRNVIEAANWALTLKGTGDKAPALAEKGKGQFVGGELRGKKLAVIGLGAVGGKVANAAYNLKMTVEGFDPYLSVDHAWALSRAVKKAASLEVMLEDAHFVSIHVPYIPDTKNYVNSALISHMRDGAVLINLSRAELVDSAAIKEALESGKISKYVTDFVTDDLLGLNNVISLPHLGASTPESEDNCAQMAAEQLDAYLATGSIRNSVNFPACELEPWENARVCVMHRNIPAMITKITGAVSESGVNIEHMVNTSKQDAAYTVLDLGGNCAPSVVSALNAIPGVMRVRVIA